MNIIKIQSEAERHQGIYYEYDRDSTPLGVGGMGRIFQGFRMDERGYRSPVAIKEIHDNIARDPQLIERAMREASIQIDHENLLRMYGFVPNVEFDAVSGANIMRYYMIMERLVGVNLDQILNGVIYDRSGMMIPYAQELYNLYTTDRAEAITRIMKGVLAGIMALHEKGFIHRDIDPSNVMITIDNKIKLIDYGVCKHINMLANEKTLTVAGSFIGKVNYAAPELAMGDVSHQNRTTDLYAVGVLIYQLAVGSLPFNGTHQEVLAAQCNQKMPVGNILNKDLRHIVDRATQKRQDRRYASAAEMIVDLERVKTSTSTGISEGYSNSDIPWWVWVAAVAGGVLFGIILNMFV